jgi:hypothetical protein
LIAEVRMFGQDAKKLLAANQSEIRLAFEAFEAGTNLKLASLGTAEIVPTNGKSESKRSLKATAALTGKRIVLRPVVQNVTRERSDMLYSLIHVHDHDHLSKKAASNESQPMTQGVPLEFHMGPVYPNPFNPTATINYSLPKDAHVVLKVYDVLGKEVATLVNENKAAGYYRAVLDGKAWATGVYLCRLRAGEFSQTMKVTLVK